MPQLPIGTIHFHHLDLMVVKESGQAGAIRTGALHPNPGECPEPLEPPQQAALAGLGGLERLNAQHSAEVIQCRSDMEIGVGIDTATNTRVSTMVIAIPFSRYVCKGVARTAGTADVDAVEAVAAASTDVTPPDR